MEWKEVINILFFGGLMFLMMRFGCCGSHRHGGSKHEGHKGGCCGGSPAEQGKAEQARKSCH